jgi:hypothetical protein
MTSMKVHGRIPGAKAPTEWRLIAGLKPRASTTRLAAELPFAQDKKLRPPKEPVLSHHIRADGGF